MRAVILAGGYATRLWPITRHRPKMFLPLGETIVIDRIYAELEAEDRIDEVYVSTNERFADVFAAHLADQEYDKPRLSIEETVAEDEKLGVVGALGELIDREGVEEDLLIIAGDNIFDFPISGFLDEYERQAAPTIATYDLDNLDRVTAYGVVDLDENRVIGFEEKPDDPASTCVSVGCYAFPQSSLSLVETYLAGDHDPDEIGWFVKWLHAKEATYAYSYDGIWFDVGTLDSYLDAVSWKLDGDSLVHDTARLEETTVGSTVHVMADARLDAVDVERAVIFPDVSLETARVRGSVVDKGAELAGVDLDRAMVGAYTHITNR